MNGFVYKWVNDLNGKWYSGSHKGNPEDGYDASGIMIQRAFKKHGIENFTRHIIYEGPDYRLVEDLHLKSHNAKEDPDSYNLKNDAIGGWGHCRGLGHKYTKGHNKNNGGNKGMKLPAVSKYMKENNPNKGWNQTGTDNPNSKKVKVFDVEYGTMKMACDYLKISRYKLKKILNNGQ